MKYNAVLFDWAQTLKGKKEIPSFVLSLIPQLFDSGYRLGIISNSHRYGDARWLRSQLGKLNWIQYFEVVVGSGGMLGPNRPLSTFAGIHKPDSEIFYRALNFINIEPQKAVFIGDSYRCDIMGAKRLGMEAILVDVDKEDYSHRLWNVLEDKPTFRHIVTTYEWISHSTIRIYIRDLSEPLKNGDTIILGTDTFTINWFSTPHNKEDILDTGGAGYQLMEIGLKYL